MPQLSRGQKTKLADLTPALQLRAQISARANGLTFDFSCFGIDANGKLSDDRYFVFYNQTASPENAIQLQSAGVFDLDLSRVPTSIARLVFVATIDGQGTLANLQAGAFVLSAGGSEVARFELVGKDYGAEKAIMVAEVYKKDVWRVAAVGQGFAGGLDAVLKHFGGEEIEAAPAPVVATPPPAPKVEPPKTVNLEKAGASAKIDLGKKAGEIIATATWVDNGDKRDDNDDLDLRAGLLYPNGSMSIITCTKPGSLLGTPFIFHQGDIKSASLDQPGQEIMKVSPQIADKLGGDCAIVFSIYSAIANGPVAIASLKPKMTLQYGGQTVNCNLDFTLDKAAKKQGVYTYVIGLAVIRNGQIEISPGGQVSQPGSEATPWLQWDGNGGAQLTMDGPAVIKSGGKVLSSLLNAGNKKRYI